MKVNFTLTQREIDEMKVRCSSATNGPWKSQIEGRDHMGGSSFIMTGDDDIYLNGATTADQDFMAHARQDVPRLIAEIERLHAQLGRKE